MPESVIVISFGVLFAVNYIAVGGELSHKPLEDIIQMSESLVPSILTHRVTNTCTRTNGCTPYLTIIGLCSLMSYKDGAKSKILYKHNQGQQLYQNYHGNLQV